MFMAVAKKSRTFFSFPCWLMSRHAGAGREHSQAASPSWPIGICHTMDLILSL